MRRPHQTTSATEIVAAWERAEAGSGLSARKQNQLVDEADRLVDLTLAEPASLRDVVALLDAPATSSRLKRWIRGRILPDLSSAQADMDGFRAHALVGFGAEVMPIRRCLALVETNDKIIEERILADPESPECLGWLAGPAAGDHGSAWPESAAGVPLVHVAAIDLAATADNFGRFETIFTELDLPKTGVLQLFHDLETSGNEPDGRCAHAWQVQWIEHASGLLKRSDPLRDLYREPVAFAPIPAVSIPPIVAVDLPDGDAERYTAILDYIEDDLRSPVNTGTFEDDNRPSRWEGAHVPEDPTSRIGGFGQSAWNDEFETILTETLPLASADDSYFLLFNIAGVRHLEGWFGDAGHLQVWIRRSDLRARQFQQVWCLIRTE